MQKQGEHKRNPDDPLAKQMKAAGKAYAAACRRDGPGHSNGPPHHQIYVVLLAGFLLEENLPAVMHAQLEAAQKKATEKTNGQLARDIRHCKIASCYKATKSCITICFGPGASEAKDAVHAAMQAKEYQTCLGKAPQGAMEDEHGRLL